ncbi:nucleoside triphosphate pyrophosphohydrolase [Mycolicibacterium flavescens]|uniref:Phosphoribosyl-ATP pyrophosphohydrolase n=1 Tax=Mycolicibacterium flavescens TaxID=1776 RepID=A0A1E3RM02_MYCFV|nr:nucleoside triphosphate pyrophosphohydrolase [Mycolicibacterium flavescens]MCV7281685.1 nucleoside triphosphate pyrophosphohydrolase [Mycolicibacterium flavescens]ODQ90913.1 phosphoribosyl-ATP pyrophosphohydrolase [Mycolicibacterium flavescens]
MGKLVRDRIPELIRESGRTPHVVTLSPNAYRRALLDKLREEAMELSAVQTTEPMLEEAADVLEVLAAIAVEHGVTLDTIGEVARTKREKRGGFAMRLWLEAIDPGPEAR